LGREGASDGEAMIAMLRIAMASRGRITQIARQRVEEVQSTVDHGRRREFYGTSEVVFYLTVE
jgi:hypothetical protein